MLAIIFIKENLQKENKSDTTSFNSNGINVGRL